MSETRLESTPEAGMRWHPYAEIFPWIEGPEFDALIDDVKKRGVLEPIVMFEGMLLDGRNRYMAARSAGIQYPVTEYRGTDPLGFVLAKNLTRRHLTESQRAMVAAKIAKLPLGANQHGGSENLPTQAEAAAQLNVSDRSVRSAKTVQEEGIAELGAAVESGAVAVSAAEKIARLPKDSQPAALEKALPGGARAIMGSRQEPPDSLDFFPTPPWATRALFERVFRDANLPPFEINSVWEPACGEGHITEVLDEYVHKVIASDVFDYGYGEFEADFLNMDRPCPECDWIITNPPFGSKAENFVRKALTVAEHGVAMFFRMQWLEGVTRYEEIFKDNPPTLVAFFAERVNLCKGRWEPGGSTATAYVWLVWVKGAKPQAPFWIPPGCREQLTKPDDAERFTQHPVAGPIQQAAE